MKVRDAIFGDQRRADRCSMPSRSDRWPLLPPSAGHEYDVSFLKHEFTFERLVDLAD